MEAVLAKERVYGLNAGLEGVKEREKNQAYMLEVQM